MGWLDAVKQFATNVAAGQNPDAVLKKAQLMDEFKNTEQRRNLAASQEQRAQGEFGQAQKDWEEKNANRPTRDKLAALGLSKAEQDAIISAQNAKQETFTTEHQPEAFNTEQTGKKATTAATLGHLKIAGQAESRLQRQAGEESQLNAQRLEAAKRTNEVEKATQQARIDATNDPTLKSSQEIAQLGQMYAAAMREGSESSLKQADDIYGQIQMRINDAEREKAVRAVKRQIAGTLNR